MYQPNHSFHENFSSRESKDQAIQDLKGAILEIWRQIFANSDIEVEDDFFALGGDSFLFLQMIGAVSTLLDAEDLYAAFESQKETVGDEIGQPLFAQLTVSRLAERLYLHLWGNTARQAKLPLTRSQQHIAPASFAQKSLWFFEQLSLEVSPYTIISPMSIRGTLHIEALDQSLREIVERHEPLRTSLHMIEGELMQAIHQTPSSILKITDLSSLQEVQQRASVADFLNQEKLQHFDMTNGPLFRATLLKLTAEEHILVLTMHHVVTDGWSHRILLEEFNTLYEAFSKGQTSSLPSLSISYSDFAHWQQERLKGVYLEQLLSYWKKELNDAPHVLRFPTDRPRPPAQTFRGAHHYFHLSRDLTVSLQELSQQESVTLFMTLLAAFQILLFRYSGQEDICIGSTVANRPLKEFEQLIGFFANTLVMRTDLSGNPSFREILARVRDVACGAYLNQELPFELIVSEIRPERNMSYNPLFQFMFVFQNMPDIEVSSVREPSLSISPFPVSHNVAPFDITLTMWNTLEGLAGEFNYSTDLFEDKTIRQLTLHFQKLIEQLVASPQYPVKNITFLSPHEQQDLLTWNQTSQVIPEKQCIHHLFEEQVQRTPKAIALSFEDQQLTYKELNQLANQLAYYLQQVGVSLETPVGLCLERSPALIIGLFGILKAGGCYVPLDPNYPAARIAFMLQDAKISILLTQKALNQYISSLTRNEETQKQMNVIYLDTDWPRIAAFSQYNPPNSVSWDNLAYIIYTSGSTGNPNGVMVTHRNVINFFTGMNYCLKEEEPGTWLAITSIAFDISILELCWTLTRGFKVVLLSHRDELGLPLQKEESNVQVVKKMDFSLFYFANNDEIYASEEKYKLLLDGAKFADQRGFAAVWTPERHFHPFGGLYPNPSVLSAAIAVITNRIGIRAGSVVLPLHNPVRVAEEWSIVDNLSQGRIGISFASGWQENDFALAPDHYIDRKNLMIQNIEIVRKLWRGEPISLRNGVNKQAEVRVFPRPHQPELPVWITSAGNADTFKLAGEIGANLFTHLLGQSIQDLADKISVYREARRAYLNNPSDGHVALMLHTFIGSSKDEVLDTVRQPFLAYLKSSFSMARDIIRSLGQDIQTLSEDDINSLLIHAFNRYYETSSLIGTPESCLTLISTLKRIGVDEIACLIDFGIESNTVLKSLHYLNEVRERSNVPSAIRREDYSLLSQLQRHQVTHMQCTPSLARILVEDPEILKSMKSLRKLLLGGEALPNNLAALLSNALPAQIINMYGPTETTVWSTTYTIDKQHNNVLIGHPIANTQVHILDQHLQPLPIGIPGELVIGGFGVARGYLNRPALTSERFIPDPFTTQAGKRLYKTGDLARFLPDGSLEFLGRLDQQVKIRGFRVELGEIEEILNRHSGISESAVLMREDHLGEQSLIAYIVPKDLFELEEATIRTLVSQVSLYLKEKLPAFMVPAVFEVLSSFPLTPNGKLNRKALPEPTQVHISSKKNQVEPRTSTEKQLVTIWKTVLGLEYIGIHDNFFALGGNSLKAIKLVFQINSMLNVTLPLRDIFEASTIAELAQLIDEAMLENHFSS